MSLGSYDLLILKSTSLRSGFRGEPVVPKASNMAEEHPGDGRAEMAKSKSCICLFADTESRLQHAPSPS